MSFGSLAAWHNGDVKSRGCITPATSSAVWRTTQRTTVCVQYDCLKGKMMVLYFSCFCVGKQLQTDAYIVMTATHANRLLLSGWKLNLKMTCRHSIFRDVGNILWEGTLGGHYIFTGGAQWFHKLLPVVKISAKSSLKPVFPQSVLCHHHIPCPGMLERAGLFSNLQLKLSSSMEEIQDYIKHH